VYADYRRAPGAASTPTFTDQARRGRPLARAQVSTSRRTRRRTRSVALRAGARTIEHGEASDATSTRWLARDGALPTLAAVEAMTLTPDEASETGGRTSASPPHARLPRARRGV
jgi:hypothetical protein